MQQIQALSDGRQGKTKNDKRFTKFDVRVIGEDFTPAPTVTIWEHVNITSGDDMRADLQRKEDYNGRAQFWARNVTDVPGPNHAGIAPKNPAVSHPATGMTVDEAASLFGRALAAVKQQVDLVFPSVSDAEKLAVAQSQATSIFISATRNRAVVDQANNGPTDKEVNQLKREILEVMSNDTDKAREICTTTLSGFEVESFTDLSMEDFQSASDLAHTAAHRVVSAETSDVPF